MATPPLGSKKQVTSTDTSVTPPVVKKGHIGTHIIQWFKDTFSALSKKMKGAWESVKSYFSKPKPQSLKNHTAVGLQPDKENPPITNTPIVARRPSGMATPSQTPAMQPGRSQQPKGPSRVVLLDEAVGADGNLRTFAREENVFVRKPREQNQPIVTPTAASPSAAHVGVIAPKEPLQPAVRVPRLKNINTQKLNDAVVPEDIVKLANAKKESSGVPLLYTENQKVIYNGLHSEGRNLYATISYIAPEESEGHGQCALKIENVKGIIPAQFHELTPIPEDLASAPQTPAPSLGAGAAPAPSPAAAATAPQTPEQAKQEDSRLGKMITKQQADERHSHYIPKDSFAAGETVLVFQYPNFRYGMVKDEIKGTKGLPIRSNIEITISFGKDANGIEQTARPTVGFVTKILQLPAYKPVEPPAAAVAAAPAQPVESPLPGAATINPMRDRVNIKKHNPSQALAEQVKAEPVASEQPSSRLETVDAVSPEMPKPPTNEEDPRLGNVVNESDLSPSVGVAAAPAQPAAPSPGAEQINPMRARVNIQKHKPSKPDERPVEASVAAGAGAKAAKAGRGYVRPVLGSIVAMANELGNEIRGIIVGVIEEDDLFYINFPPSKDNIPCKLIDKYQNILVTLDGKESFVKVIEVKKSEKEKGGLRFKNNI